VFGGTFDPVHLGHMAAAEEAMCSAGLDRVMFVPAGNPWIKDNRLLSDGLHRRNMVEIAISSNPNFCVSEIEVVRPGPSYSADTLEYLKAELGDEAELYSIIGADVLKDIRRWVRLPRVLELSSIIIVHRPGFDQSELSFLQELSGPKKPGLVIVERPSIEISGTQIRELSSREKPASHLLPLGVDGYIKRNGLYACRGRGDCE